MMGSPGGPVGANVSSTGRVVSLIRLPPAAGRRAGWPSLADARSSHRLRGQGRRGAPLAAFGGAEAPALVGFVGGPLGDGVAHPHREVHGPVDDVGGIEV